jgi:peptidyl-prolyl cis-trans isomerase SurA
MNVRLENREERNGPVGPARGAKRGPQPLSIALMLCCGLLCLGFPDGLIFRAEVIDRLVAVVNRQIITLGDVEREMKLQELDPLTGDLTGMSSSQQPKVTQDLLVQRLIEQTLIREQIQQFPGLEIADEQVQSQVAAIEKKVGGAEKLAQMKVDSGALQDRLRWQLQVMKFIDYRFRQFVVVDTKEIEAYYQNQFLPELQKRNVVPAPGLPEVEERIRKIVTEEKLNTQVDEWLASLRKDATIEIFH